MPGGEQAVREPWRMAVAHLRDAGVDCEAFEKRVDPVALRAVGRMIERAFRTPRTSSAGRLFDAVAALVGGRQRVSYEGQAAMELEWMAERADPEAAAERDWIEGGAVFSTDEQAMQLDTRPIIAAVARAVNEGVAAAVIARRFHRTMAEWIGAVCGALRERTGLERVVLSGVVFMNALLVGEVDTILKEKQFRPFRHRLVPANDGGLSLGQLAIAAASGGERR
jgi:hydrogenase maturation protein HypF